MRRRVPSAFRRSESTDWANISINSRRASCASTPGSRHNTHTQTSRAGRPSFSPPRCRIRVVPRLARATRRSARSVPLRSTPSRGPARSRAPQGSEGLLHGMPLGPTFEKTLRMFLERDVGRTLSRCKVVIRGHTLADGWRCVSSG